MTKAYEAAAMLAVYLILYQLLYKPISKLCRQHNKAAVTQTHTQRSLFKGTCFLSLSWLSFSK